MREYDETLKIESSTDLEGLPDELMHELRAYAPCQRLQLTGDARDG